MLDDRVSGQILGLFGRGSRGGRGSRRLVVGRGGGMAADEVHLGVREIAERVGPRLTRAEEEP